MIKNIINSSLQYLSNLRTSKPQELLELIRQKQTAKALELINCEGAFKLAPQATTALMLACAHDCKTEFEAIINSPFATLEYLTATNSDGDSALHYGATFNNMEFIKKLVEKGVNINAKNNLGKTALLIICDNSADGALLQDRRKTLETVRALIELKANVNAVDNELNTPLIRAAMNNSTEIVDYLLSQGANPRLKNSSGYSAFRYSLEKGNKEIAISLILSLNNPQLEAHYAQSLKESTAYPYIKPTLDILKNKEELETHLPEKTERKKSIKI